MLMRPKQSSAPVSLPVLEQQFGQSANSIYELLLDLNTPTEKLHATWREIMGLRGRILTMYGIEQPPEPPAAMEVRRG
eukprot:CAMPEP_0115252342 /NCGR_PEP_ID=MMETSP0270-20121206/44095_1 /TAXON_ID=71861 /ORGANISM="Scrippsiella trochoidea, Strain CCMP3099" /LENGTH=77 /DNA_ID=CAMNT_0002667789 /DNA_START=82 /DNA_END=311 /DNA_ORIENTATION=+